MTDQEINEFLATKLMGYELYGMVWWHKNQSGKWLMATYDWDPVNNISQALGDGGPGTVVYAVGGG